MSPSVVGIIIAGGQSRRFNQKISNKNGCRDKFLMPFGQTTLLGHIISRAQRQIPDLLLNINGDRRRVLSCGVDVFADECPGMGPLGGFLGAMKEAASRGYSHIVTFSGDSPFFPDDYVDRLVSTVQKRDSSVISCSGDKVHPVMGLFSVSLQDDLNSYLQKGGRRVMGWISCHPYTKVVWHEKNPDPFLNINRPDDLEEAGRYLALDSFGHSDQGNVDIS